MLQNMYKTSTLKVNKHQEKLKEDHWASLVAQW